MLKARYAVVPSRLIHYILIGFIVKVYYAKVSINKAEDIFCLVILEPVIKERLY